MGRNNPQATAGATAGLTNSGALSGDASSLYSTLAPSLSSEAAAPPGYAPSDLAAMRTAAEQGAGGTVASAQGEGALQAGRTRNNAAYAPSIAEATRTAGRTLTNAGTGIQTANANLKEKQHEEALGGLEGLYGTDVTGANQSLGATAANVNANTGAVNSSYDWATDVLNPLLSIGASNFAKKQQAAG